MKKICPYLLFVCCTRHLRTGPVLSVTAAAPCVPCGQSLQSASLALAGHRAAPPSLVSDALCATCVSSVKCAEMGGYVSSRFLYCPNPGI